jgi:hypothetical protein
MDACGIAYTDVLEYGQTLGVVKKSCAVGYYSFGHEVSISRINLIGNCSKRIDSVTKLYNDFFKLLCNQVFGTVTIIFYSSN